MSDHDSYSDWSLSLSWILNRSNRLNLGFIDTSNKGWLYRQETAPFFDVSQLRRKAATRRTPRSVANAANILNYQ